MKGLFSNLKGDFFGGITAGIVALPLALAFGVSSGLGPSAGLYGAIFIGFFAALFGGTNTQISGPTAPMTAVSMVVVAGIVAANKGDVNQALPAILTVFLLAGLIQILLGVLKLGNYIRYIPYPVVSGFMTAIGIIIIVTQILPSLGYYPLEDKELLEKYRPRAQEVVLENILKDEAEEGILVLEDFKETIRRANYISEEDVMKEAKILAANDSSGVIGTIKVLPKALGNINFLELFLALGTILIIYGFKKITTAVPSTLVALVVMTLVAILFNFDYKPIAKIPDGFPIPKLEIITEFKLGAITPYIFAAITLSLLGAIDSLLTSLVADNMTKTKHQPNKELVGQGIGNSIAALFGGIPGAGATIRTVVNIQSGGKTRLSGMIAGLLLLVTLLLLGPIASTIPAAVLAGILITVGIGVIDYKGLKAIPSLPKDLDFGWIKISSEVMVMFVVMILSAVWNLVYAVGIGFIIASLMFMKQIGNLTAQRSSVKTLSQKKSWADQIGIPENLKEEVFVKYVKGPLFFGSTEEFENLAAKIPATATTVIFRFGRMQYIDQSGLYTLLRVIQDLQKAKIKVLFVNLLKQPRYMMERIDVIPDVVAEEFIFENFDECKEWITANVRDVV
ncbi:SulP family inorganic anion transporter [Mesonia sp. K7]|uniref:SulP family inorganic anion transporter n=1 Tax=Mesonia sp. K7 TaxID=2218606 RepID=UPI000DA71851|nr:SulP family inorganic anion transporter [Mesonia sp. K7]PZD79027.1 sodium-independent anion transporter [Mesonia sp. K7]